MKEITVTVPGYDPNTYPANTPASEILQDIAPKSTGNAVAARMNGQLWDWHRGVSEDGELEAVAADSDEGHSILLHSTAHLMAQAVKQLYPEAKVTIGPTIENRFYYDFDMEIPFTDEDLSKIEERMRELAAEGLAIDRQELPRKEALSLFKKMGESYKVEIVDGIADDESLSAYTQGDFTDLCRGPHVPSTDFIKHFKLLNTAGAYWRGDESNKMLQRIYGTAFATKKRLKQYLHFLEEAKKRDHRKLGKELELFSFDDEVGPGLPLWLPNGAIIIDELENLARETEKKAGYQRVRTPHITKGTLYEKSGHLKHYRDSMYPAMDVDGVNYYIKPMNCPHHHKIYASSPRSYRDLPVRLAEYGTCYRYEKSGQLFGLMRVRSMQMNDAHIYCTEDQLKEEFLAVSNIYMEYFSIFGIEKYEMDLCVHSADGLGNKYVNEPELWIKTEQAVREALDEGNINYVEIPGEAAFYGPKIDVQVWSAIGKKFTLATNQVDFAIPSRFDLTYTNEKNEEETPLCIHRAPLGTHERFIGFLIEHFGGDFPLWLAPTQIIILPVSDKFIDYAEQLSKQLTAEGFRVEVDSRSDKIGAKIRNAEMRKISVMFIVGGRESEKGTVSVRRRFTGDLGEKSVDEIVDDLKREIKNKRRQEISQK
ncbi:MAG: threonine--tRNA ligase [Candidatus Marinimicrobia bacterium]|jgi:threonyl-tRNA synthetase|nr:threonine--tRNA ligase [Candidatus Neomarinimicrobiota bacterium]MDP6593722.1 threonine--tRNA ligase [Candidatus Neomarinimicrobiota bacterium]|tara:strand:- start:5746 stop:7701 length:1956 start_codon:yes stop_codon:yes gene_type:complete